MVWINYFSSWSHLIFSPSPFFHFPVLIFNLFFLVNMSGLVCTNYMGFVFPWVGLFLMKFSVFSVNLCSWLSWLLIGMGFTTAFFVPFAEECLQPCLIIFRITIIILCYLYPIVYPSIFTFPIFLSPSVSIASKFCNFLCLHGPAFS